MFHILIADDERAIADIIRFNLVKEGYQVSIAGDGAQCLQMIEEEEPDLLLLDVMMPKKDGFEVLAELRKQYKFPVIMITAKEQEGDVLRGFELGADDYVVKPFSVRQLLARIKANLRRSDAQKEDELEENIEAGEIFIDVNKYEVTKNGKVIDLTLREYELLKFLAQSPNQVFSREQLLEKVWGYEYYGDIRTVDVTVRRLREKVEKGKGEFRYILTKRGVGYYFGG